MIEEGIAGMTAGSSTGEFINYSREEWNNVLKTVKDRTMVRAPLLAGGDRTGTPETVERCKYAQKRATMEFC